MNTFTRASSLSVEDGKLDSSLASSLRHLGVDVWTRGLVRLLPSGETIGELSDSYGGNVAGIMPCKQVFTSPCNTSNLFLAFS